MDGHQVGHHKGPEQQLLADADLPGVDNDRKRAGDALVAAAGIDDDRKLAAAHSRVRRRRGSRLGTVLHRGAVGAHQHAPDLGAPVFSQSFLGDRGVVPDLPVQSLFHIFKFHLICKVNDGPDVQKRIIRRVIAGFIFILLTEVKADEDLFVFLQTDHIGMGSRDLTESSVLTCAHPDLDVEDEVLIRLFG